MNIIFLDIDGVLNSYRTVAASGGYPHDFQPWSMDRFDPVAIKLVKSLCLESLASVVLSSSWKHEFTAKEVADGLDLPVIDVTPNLPDVRGHEIQAWLNAHTGVKNYVILDDCGDMLESQKDHFVQTKHAEGLSYENYCKASEILKGKLGGSSYSALWPDEDDSQ